MRRRAEIFWDSGGGGGGGPASCAFEGSAQHACKICFPFLMPPPLSVCMCLCVGQDGNNCNNVLEVISGDMDAAKMAQQVRLLSAGGLLMPEERAELAALIMQQQQQ